MKAPELDLMAITFDELLLKLEEVEKSLRQGISVRDALEHLHMSGESNAASVEAAKPPGH